MGWFTHPFLLVAFFLLPFFWCYSRFLFHTRGQHHMRHRNLLSVNLHWQWWRFSQSSADSVTDFRFSGAGKGPTSTVELDLVFYKKSPLFSATSLFFFSFSLFFSGGVYNFYISDFFLPGSVLRHSVILHINSELGIGEEGPDDLKPTCFCLNGWLLCGLHCLIGLCSDPPWLLPSCFVIPVSISLKFYQEFLLCFPSFLSGAYMAV